MHNYETLRAALGAAASWIQCEVSCEDQSCAAEDKAERDYRLPPFCSCTPHCVTLNIIKHSPSVTHNTTKHSSGAMLLKQTLCWNPSRLRRVVEELRRRMWGRPRTHSVYAEQPASGKRTEHDPHVFLTPANPTKRQREQIPLQRKLPLRYLSTLRQTSGPAGLFS